VAASDGSSRPRAATAGQQNPGAGTGSKAPVATQIARHLAEKLEDLDAFAAAKLIPDGIRCYGREHGVEQRSEKTQVAGPESAPAASNMAWKGPATQLPAKPILATMRIHDEGGIPRRAVHAGGVSDLRLFSLRKEQMPPMTSHDKSAIACRVLGPSHDPSKAEAKEAGSPG